MSPIIEELKNEHKQILAILGKIETTQDLNDKKN